MSDRKGVNSMGNPKLNGSGCKDLTAYDALRNIEREEKYKKLIATIFNICDLSGFHLEGRIVLKDTNTGKIWR